MPEALAAEAFIGLLGGGEALAIGAGAEMFGAAALGGAAAGTAGASAIGAGLTAAEIAGVSGAAAEGAGAWTALGAEGALGAGGLAGGESLLNTGGTFGGLEALSAAAPASFGMSAVPAGAGAGFSFPSISQLGSGMNIASSIYGMSQADQMKKLAMMQANKATPWQSAGGGDLAAQQLMALISGKTDVSQMPGWAAGKQAVERSGAAQGWLGSGNMMASLNKFGGDFYNNAVTQLSGLAGTQFNPASGGQMAMNGAMNSAALNLAAMSNINKTIETQPAWR